MKTFITACFFFLLLQSSYAQSGRYKLIIKIPEKYNKDFKFLRYSTEVGDSAAAMIELKNVLLSFRKASYILANIDSVKNNGKDSIIAFIDPSYPFKWAKLGRGNVSDVVLNKTGFKERLYQNKDFNEKEFAALFESFLRYSENNGYPFATVQLDSIEFLSENKISGRLNYNQGPFITFDSIQIIGKARIKKKFLSSYLRIFSNQPFNQEKVNNIDKLLRELVYLRQTRPYSIIFNQDKATINLFLEDKKSNQIDGIVGLLPNQTSNKKLLVTGELNMNLKNLFGSGKNFSGEWRKFNQASQLLNLHYFHPKLLTSNLDVRIDFNLLKQDSTFLTIDRKITVYQKTGKSGTLNFSGGDKSSREFLKTVPSRDTSFANFDYINYGLGYSWNNLNDIFFPRKGWYFTTQLGGGNKKIIKNAALPDSLYNNIKLNSVQLNLSLFLEKYSALGKRSVLVTRLQGGKLFNNKENLFFNDLYRVGGLKTLRGFAENYFYASTFAVGTIEYRFYTEETSYLLLFIDQGYLNNTLGKSTPTDYPFGFGAGVSFSTGPGIFNFVYSLGNSNTQKISLNLSKIHFGIITRF